MMRAERTRGETGTIGLALASALGLLIVLGFLSSVQLRSTSEAVHMATRDAGGAVAEELSGEVRFDPRVDGGGPWIAKRDLDETPDGPRERNAVALDHCTVALLLRVTRRVMLRSRAQEEAR